MPDPTDEIKASFGGRILGQVHTPGDIVTLAFAAIDEAFDKGTDVGYEDGYKDGYKDAELELPPGGED